MFVPPKNFDYFPSSECGPNSNKLTVVELLKLRNPNKFSNGSGWDVMLPQPITGVLMKP